LIVVLFFVIISGTLLIGVANPVTNQIRNTSEFLKSKQSYAVADAQAENALYRLNSGRTDAPGTLSILGAIATADVTDIGDIKEIAVDGVFGQFKRFLKTQFKQDSGVAFNYGLQAGVGGIELSGSSYIVGNVYSNGDITGNGGSGWYTTYVTGGVTIANVSDPIAHIDNSTSAGDNSFDIGQNNTNQDFAESFTYSTSSPVTEIELYLKRTSTLPANATVKIVNNSSGAPGSTVLVSGTLNASLSTAAYSYVPVAMTTTTALVSGSTYWIVIDVPANNTNYYTLGTNDSTYGGATKIGRFGTSWANMATTTADMKFKMYVGGDVGTISGMGVGTSGTGDLWANTVTNTTVTGSLYCQSGTGNNKVCDTSRADPPPSNMPISQGNIDAWKADAAAGGATTTMSLGGVTVKTMGPIKVNGNLSVGNSARLNIVGVIHVTGNLTVNGSAKIYVDSSMGANSGVIVVDGTVDLGGSGGVYGSGTAGSYVIIADTSSCPGTGCTSTPAILVSGAAGSVVLNAPNGNVEFSGSAGVKAVAAKKMIMSGATNITYESGLASLDFTSGPSGGWSINSWNEVEEN
jgi:hypothetical protein